MSVKLNGFRRLRFQGGWNTVWGMNGGGFYVAGGEFYRAAAVGDGVNCDAL